jgi:hypothetical protein
MYKYNVVLTSFESMNYLGCVNSTHVSRHRAQLPLPHIVFDYRVPTRIVVFLLQPFEDSLAGVPLLRISFLSASKIWSMIPTNASSLGRFTGCADSLAMLYSPASCARSYGLSRIGSRLPAH